MPNSIGDRPNDGVDDAGVKLHSRPWECADENPIMKDQFLYTVQWYMCASTHSETGKMSAQYWTLLDTIFQGNYVANVILWTHLGLKPNSTSQ